MYKETKIFAHQPESEFCKAFCIIFHDTRAQVAEEGSTVLSSVIALNHTPRLVGEQVAGTLGEHNQ